MTRRRQEAFAGSLVVGDIVAFPARDYVILSRPHRQIVCVIDRDARRVFFRSAARGANRRMVFSCKFDDVVRIVGTA